MQTASTAYMPIKINRKPSGSRRVTVSKIISGLVDLRDEISEISEGDPFNYEATFGLILYDICNHLGLDRTETDQVMGTMKGELNAFLNTKVGVAHGKD